MNHSNDRSFEGAYAAARDLLRDDLARFDAGLAEVLHRQQDFLTGAEQDLYRRGKHLRPTLLLLSARAGLKSPEAVLEERVIAAAVSVEIIHVGSLIHDDIVDKAPVRRGMPTINASRGYEMAMLIGDLQFIEASRLFSSFIRAESDIQLMRRFLDTGYTTCRGQIDELLSERVHDTQALVQRYYRIVDRKTGQLIAFCCEAGARLADAMPTTIGSLKRFGTLLGRAFQVMDDVLDVVRSTEDAGKQRMTDLAQGRLSLPIVYAMDEAAADDPLRRLLDGEPLPESLLQPTADRLRRGNGWIRAYSDARAIVAKALANLELIPDSIYRQTLASLANHLVDQGFE